MAQTPQAGQLLRKDFYMNMGGLNLTDSPFLIKDEQAIDGYNYDYNTTGGFRKSLSPQAINTVADSQLKTLGLGLYNTKDSAKSIVRAAGTKIQLVTLDGVFTDLTEDTATINSDFLVAGSNQQVVNSMFVTPNEDTLWLAGGGMAIPRGVVSTTQVTENGVDVPQGSISTTVVADGLGDWSLTGVGLYFVAIAFQKASTGASSNAVLDTSFTVVNLTDSVILDLTGITTFDETKYDSIIIYLSNVGSSAVSGFSAGNLVAAIPSTSTSYSIEGDFTQTAVSIPRAGNPNLDFSQLPAATYNVLTTWKQRLVTANGNIIYLSDINRPESWPTQNTIQIPSGGAITGLAILAYSTWYTNTPDEMLVIFKEAEVWIISGTGPTDWALKFIDSSGCIAQNLIVKTNGYLFFIDNRGIYMWDGTLKPTYISRPVEQLFSVNGALDRSKLFEGVGTFYRPQNQIIWYLSHSILGEQKYMLKLDTRLTMANAQPSLGQRILEGTFIQGKVSDPVYAVNSFVFPTSSSQQDIIISGDDEGFVYRQFYTTGPDNTDLSNDVSFTYETRPVDFGTPGTTKSFNKVIAWVENVGNYNLLLDYWTDYKTQESERSTSQAIIEANTNGTFALWDVAFWDQAFWDNYTARAKPLVFNLQGQPSNNSQGDALRLRFRQEGAGQPVMVYGFTVLYAEQAMRK